MGLATRGIALALLLALPGCTAAPLRDACADGLDVWLAAGGGRGESRTTGVLGETRDDAWDVRAGVNVHFDLTGGCWDYEMPPTGPRPEAVPERHGIPAR